MASNRENLIEIFKDSQEPHFDIDKGLYKLRLIINTTVVSEQKSDFLFNLIEILIHCVKIVLISTDNYRTYFVIEFLIQILIQLNGTEAEKLIQNELINFLIKINRSNSDTVRLRLFEILKKYIDVSNGELDEKLFSKIEQISLEGIRDCNPNVQKNAIKLATRLQTPIDTNCKITNAFISLLEHDSNAEIRLLILESIVINKLTFNIVKTKLLYDSVKDVRNKILEIIIKKVPNEFIDPKFKKEIINMLIRDKNEDLLDKFIQKLFILKPRLSLYEQILEFVKGLDLRNVWLFEYEELDYNEGKLSIVLNILFKTVLTFESSPHLCESLTSLVTNNYIFKDLNTVFIIRSLKSFSQIFPNINSKNFYKILINNINKIDDLVLYFLIDLIYDENSNLNILKDIIYSTDYLNQNYGLIYKKLLDRYDCKTRLNFLWNFYKTTLYENYDDTKKLLCIISIIIEKMTDEEFASANVLDLELDINDRLNLDIDIDLNHNLIEYFVENVVIVNFSNLDPKIRALAARALGHASKLNFDIAINYFEIFNKMIRFDYSEPVSEATKSLISIILNYCDSNGFSMDVLTQAFLNLENQLDCLDPTCKYLACQGFCKLLLNNVRIPDGSIILSKLVLTYFRCENDENIMSIKLRACLGEFFEKFKNDEINEGENKCRNSMMLSKTIKKVIKFLLEKNMSTAILKHVASFFYYITYECMNTRLIILNLILEEIIEKQTNYYFSQKLINVLIEFYVHDSDISLDKNFELTIKYLNQVYEKLQNLFAKFKNEKWIMSKEDQVRSLMSRIRLLKNRFSNGLKRKIEDNQSINSSKSNDQELNGTKKPKKF